VKALQKRQHGKFKKKVEGKLNPFGKFGEGKVRQQDVPKDKNKGNFCWIYVKEFCAYNCPLK